MHQFTSLSVCGLLGVLSLSASLSAHTFTPPPPSGNSAGVLERAIEKDYDVEPIFPRKEFPQLEIDIPEEQLNMDSGISIQIDDIYIEGNTVLSEESLQNIIAPYLHRELKMKDIKKLCLDIQKIYVQKGYFLARAFPPVQKVTGGKLTIQIVEGRLGNIRVIGNKHYKTSFIEKYFTRFQGKPINYDSFIKAAMLANDNTDLVVGIVFEKGKETGTADVIIRVEDKRPIHAYVDFNNYGTNANTLYRTGLRVDYGNLIVNGDTLTAVQVMGLPFSHMLFTNVGYTVPLNHYGTFLNLSYLYSHFDITKDRQSLQPGGSTNIAGIRVQQALMRTRNINTDLYLEFDYKRITNDFFDETFSIDNLRVLLGNYHIDAIDRFKGRNIGNFRVNWGIPDIFAASRAVSPHATRPGSGGRFLYLNLDYKRIQELARTQFFIVNLSTQYSFYKLPLSEQFYIGGVDTVRGYPLAIALGEQGYYANVEYHFPIPYLQDHKLPGSSRTVHDIFNLLIFGDTGGVFVKGPDPFHEHPPVYLTSLGFGFRINNLYRFSFSFDAAFGVTPEHRTRPGVVYFRVSYKLF